MSWSPVQTPSLIHFRIFNNLRVVLGLFESLTPNTSNLRVVLGLLTQCCLCELFELGAIDVLKVFGLISDSAYNINCAEVLHEKIRNLSVYKFFTMRVFIPPAFKPLISLISQLSN